MKFNAIAQYLEFSNADYCLLEFRIPVSCYKAEFFLNFRVVLISTKERETTARQGKKKRRMKPTHLLHPRNCSGLQVVFAHKI